MGYSYGHSPSGRVVLACDFCGKCGGVRKMRCPYNYCPPAATCGDCRAIGKHKAYDHSKSCKESAERYDMRNRLEANAIARGEEVINAASNCCGGVFLWTRTGQNYHLKNGQAYTQLRNDWYDKDIPMTVARLKEIGGVLEPTPAENNYAYEELQA